MKNLFLFIGLLCSFFIEAQEANKEDISQKKAAVKSLNSIFSASVLNVYQENASSKLVDLFSYFQMLTDKQIDVQFKAEVVKNIYLLFNKQNPMLIDVTADNQVAISLEKLVQKLLVSEPTFFKVESEMKSNSVDFQSWKSEFVVYRVKSGKQTNFKATQTVYFVEYPKLFGENTKEVWTTWFGAMTN